MTKTLKIDTNVTVEHGGKKITIVTDRGKLLISYDKPIAYKDYNSGITFLNEKYYKYSVTTKKHLSEFLRQDLKYQVEVSAEAIQRAIGRGVYQVVNFVEAYNG